MHIRNRLDADERAVSPVIATILMVSITVILAALMGTYVLDLGERATEKPPQASFTCEGGGMTMDSGDRIAIDRVNAASSDVSGDGDGYIEAGETVSGYSQLRWTSESGETTALLSC